MSGLLVLTRKLGEVVMIGDHVAVHVLDVRAGQVKLGFSAPDDVEVDRLEVRQRKHAEAERDAKRADDAKRRRSREGAA